MSNTVDFIFFRQTGCINTNALAEVRQGVTFNKYTVDIFLQKLFVIHIKSYNLHFVLGKSAGFIATYIGGSSHNFAALQMFD
jgi:hypothetical protein